MTYLCQTSLPRPSPSEQIGADPNPAASQRVSAPRWAARGFGAAAHPRCVLPTPSPRSAPLIQPGVRGRPSPRLLHSYLCPAFSVLHKINKDLPGFFLPRARDGGKDSAAAPARGGAGSAGYLPASLRLCWGAPRPAPGRLLASFSVVREMLSCFQP